MPSSHSSLADHLQPILPLETPTAKNTPTKTPPSLIIFIYILTALLALSIVWFAYVMLRLQREGGIEEWGLSAGERRAKRRVERERVVGVR
ncbi:hypothetical protein FKW77_009486 [Venturia effusa]|uniref:Uncharacterized protein n=1 Tax=Venturia effusa TaxID=50376 RepID=A0A517KXB9_9PEZI|nr:hypothetical protein FKW77_009486 [Venturia effusa]